MADLEQGIKYTIEADASKAEQSLKDIGKQAAENGQQIEKAMAGANAVTAALNGNFVAAVSSLGRMTKAVSGLGKMIAGATVWVAVIGAVVSVFHKWREKVAETKAKIEEFKQVRFDRHIAEMKKAQEEMAKAIDETVSAIDRQLDADTRSLTLAKEKIKAQIELNRQKELEGKSDEKKKAINAAADAKLADAERKFADSKLAAEIAANANRTEALRKLLRRQDRDAASNQRSYSSAVGDYQRIEREELEKMVAERTWNTKSQLQYLKSYRGNVRGSSREQVDARIAELEAKLKSDTADYLRRLPASMEFQGRLGKRDDYASARRRAEELGGLVTTDSDRRKKIFSAISESEEKAKELAKQKEIDKIKTKAAVQAEKNVQVELGKVRLEAAKEQARKTSLAEAKKSFLVANKQEQNAQARLTAAQSAVQRAWGWYRDKDSMKRQLEEEKANAEAKKQYEKDFEKLRFRRDWRTAKNLSVDEEATRRVALAKEEEKAAQKAVMATAANTARAANAVARISKAIEEAQNVD